MGKGFKKIAETINEINSKPEHMNGLSYFGILFGYVSLLELSNESLRTVFIGDDGVKDIQGARKIFAEKKIKTALIKRSAFHLRVYEPDEEETGVCKDFFAGKGEFKSTDSYKALKTIIEKKEELILSLFGENRSIVDTLAFCAKLTAAKKEAVKEEKQDEEAKPEDSTEEEVEVKEEKPETPEKKAEKKPAKPAAEKDPLDELVGAEEFKEYYRETKKNIELYGDKSDLIFRETLLCVSNKGSGFDQAFPILADLLEKKNLIKDKYPKRSSFGSYSDKQLKFPDRTSFVMNTVLIMDINGWVGHTSDSRFKDYLQLIFTETLTYKNLLVFVMENRSKNIIEDTLRDINDILSVRLMHFPDYTDEQLYTVAKKEFEKNGFRPDRGTPAVFRKIIAGEKADGLFYGINTVKKIAAEMAMASVRADSPEVIDSKACRSLIAEAEESDEGMQIIDNMIGVEEIKRQVTEMLKRIIFAKANSKKAPAMHMVFTGNPGTGKTTVARAVGQIFRENKLLRAGKFFECKGRDLCGQYVGETAIKTNSICKNAYGSVLFIDEAYSLASRRDSNDYGKEALDTLIAEMENHADDMIVIFAGYPDEMDALFDTNPGLKSRIPYKISFPDYTREQLHLIFMKMAKNEHYEVSGAFSKHVKDYFLALPDSVFESRQFGNARYVRNLFERTWGKAAMRFDPRSDKKLKLTSADFDAAVEELKAEDGDSRPKIGF